MSIRPLNPRSTLHALAPIGVGTSQVESLLGYLCRLAVSHSTSVAALSRWIATHAGREFSEKYDWHLSSISGIGEAAHNWSAALSALTGVERLDRLTMLPWHEVIAQSGLMATSARWCPDCLREDQISTGIPYFRLAWDIGAATVCIRHRARLVNACPHCRRTNVRHKTAYVIPGWCSYCREFLGTIDHLIPAAPEDLWKANQVAAMLTAQAMLDPIPSRDILHDTLRELVTRLDHGKSAVFARRVGLSKTTLHYWLREGGIPRLTAHLHVISQTGLALPNLLTGDLSGWPPDTVEIHQLALLFSDRARRTVSRSHDWDRIRHELSEMSRGLTVLSASEAARQLGLDVRLLYRNANKEARVLAERWRLYMCNQSERRREMATYAVEAACHVVSADGRGINLREVRKHVSPEILGGTRKVIDLLQNAKGKLG